MEIKTKGDLVNHLITKFGLASYLEYNKFDGATYFSQIECAKKVAAYLPENSFLDAVRIKRLLRIAADVDLGRIMELDELLRSYADQQFDVIFLDPVHVRPDVDFALRALPRLLRPGGFLVVHDCNPPNIEVTAVPRPDGAWYGETFKAFCVFRQANPRQTVTVDVDCGVGIIVNDQLNLEYPFNFDFTYSDFDLHRVARLGLIDTATFLQRTDAGRRDQLFCEFETGPRLSEHPRAGMPRQPKAKRASGDVRIEAQLFWAGADDDFSAKRSASGKFGAEEHSSAVALRIPANPGQISQLRWDFADCPATVRLLGIEVRDPAGVSVATWSATEAKIAARSRARILRDEADSGDVYLLSDNHDPQLELRLPPEILARIGEAWSIVTHVEPQGETLHELLLQFANGRRPSPASPALASEIVLTVGECRVLSRVRGLEQMLKRKRAAIAALDAFYSDWIDTATDPKASALIRAARSPACVVPASRAQQAADSGFNVLVVGRAKTGTTVISRTIGNSLSEHDYFLEPKATEFFCQIPAGSRNVVKIIHEHWGARGTLLRAALQNEMPFQFDKKVLIGRDPRDEMVSRMLYVAYPWCEGGHYNPIVAQRWLDLLRKKEAQPSAVPLKSLIGFQRNEMGIDVTSLPYLDDYIELLAAPPGGAHVIRYEDFIQGRLQSLENYLGRPLSSNRDVGIELQRTMRSGGRGSWAHFMCATDVEYIRNLLGHQVHLLGYEDWTLADSPSIAANTCSRYVEQLFAESLRQQRSKVN